MIEFSKLNDILIPLATLGIIAVVYKVFKLYRVQVQSRKYFIDKTILITGEL
jgi:hypothetical protein